MLPPLGMGRTISLSHKPGALTGYFAPAQQVTEALTKQVIRSSRWSRWKPKEIPASFRSGFHQASEIRNTTSLSGEGEIPVRHTVRYITTPYAQKRNLLQTGYQTIVHQTGEELMDLKRFSGLTIIEDTVIIAGLKEEEPDRVGSLLRDIAYGTDGVIIIGRVWTAPVSDLDSFFDRVVWINETPMIHEGKKIIRPDYGQMTFGDV